MKFHLCALWLGFSLGAQVAGEQSVVVVDSLMRPGAHAATIEQGIAMVGSRGTVFVRVPAFSGYTPSRLLVIDRPMKVVFQASPFAPPRQLNIFGGFRVADIGAGDEVLISNAQVVRHCFGPSGLVIEDCAGKVVIEQCNFGGGACSFAKMSIKRSAHVYFRDCWLSPGADPIPVENANVVFEGCAIVSAFSMFRLPFASVRVNTGADITLLNSYIVGDQLSPIFQAAVIMDGGILRVDAQSALYSEPSAGLLAVGPFAGLPTTGTVWADPGAVLQAGGSAPTVSPGIQFIQAPVRTLRATPAVAGGTYTVQLRGDPIDQFAAIVASPMETQPFPSLHPSIGTGNDPDYPLAWMDPMASQVLHFGSPNSSRTFSVGAAAPWSGQILQAVFLGGDNVVRLSPPVTQIIADPDPGISW